MPKPMSATPPVATSPAEGATPVAKVGFWGPAQTSPTITGDTRAPRIRRAWGLIDVIWGVVGLVGAQVVMLPLLAVIAVITYDIDLAASNGAELVTDAIAMVATTGPGLVCALLFQWGAFVGTPWWVSRRKGHGSLRLDFGLSFKKSDLWWGALIAWLMQGSMMGLNWLLQQTSLDLSGGSNTAQVTDHAGFVLVVMVLAAAIGAPLTEELFFRGLILRGLMRGLGGVDHAPVLDGVSERYHTGNVPAWHRRVGVTAAVLISSAFFGLMHLQTTTTATGATEILLGHWFVVIQTGLLGLVFALIALKTRRIGLNIVAHLVFNSTSLALVFLLR